MDKRIEMKNLQAEWTAGQQKLLDSGVKDTDVNALHRAQMMTKLIASLKKHDGPLNSDKEIDVFLEEYKKHKDLSRMLNEEIRFCRDSNLRFSVSKDCYLYRQRGISDELRVKNLCLLVQRPEARSSATIDDLRNVLVSGASPTGTGDNVCNVLGQDDIVKKVMIDLHEWCWNHVTSKAFFISQN